MSATNGSMSRVFRSKEEARISYNKMSKWYNLAASFEREFEEEGLQKLDVREGERILEIGFGTGQCIISLANLVGDLGKVYGIDVAAHILPNYVDSCPKYVEKALEEAGFHPVDAVTMPMWGLPVEIVGVQKV